ncbi:hypothetical protein [Hymenobacter properus]|uniref:Uncharacterized protein n=1 Tax=Hymenobacter properus TaxID=2791026 RepID=A0A931FIM8_9BACT|nr:hypothetical protein [Hymenobacter properus]MBF9140968.1 hypothetical protein [Hymenobacter properus]
MLRPATQPRHPDPAETRTGRGKLKYFMGRFLSWAIYLTLVGLAGWLVYALFKWSLALDAGAALFFGLPLIMLALFLLYFIVSFGFFAIVAEMPM